MDNNDRQAIQGLFDKLGNVEREMPQRDAEAERFISERVTSQPGAPYYMAQTIVMQEMALENQQREIEALRARDSSSSSSQGGGFLSRMFGGGDAPQQRPRPAAAPMAGRATSGPWSGASGQAGMAGTRPGMMGGRGGGGGFLAGAAQTAMGVAGGVLLGNAIAGMFDGGEAQAAAAEPAAEEPAFEETADEGGFFDDGGGFDEEI